MKFYLHSLEMKEKLVDLVDPNNPNVNEIKLTGEEKQKIFDTLKENIKKEFTFIYDESKEKHKYIIIINQNKDLLHFICDDNYSYHGDMKRAYDKDGTCLCLGGGKINVDAKNTTIHLNGDSGAYGSIEGKFRKLVIELLKDKYSGYSVIFDEE